MQKLITLVLADSQPITLIGLQALLSAETGFAVLACCGTGERTLQVVQQHRPDLLVIDPALAEPDWLTVLRELRMQHNPTKPVVLAATLGEEAMLQAIDLGVCAVILKSMVPPLIVRVLRAVHTGEMWVAPESAGKLLRREVERRRIGAVLSRRERELVRLVAAGLANKGIADRLCITEGTVKVHLHRIYEKLGIGNRAALVRVTLELGLG